MRDAMCHSAPLFKCARSPQHLSERMLPFVCNGIFVPPFRGGLFVSTSFCLFLWWRP